jgi:hypothetical protein
MVDLNPFDREDFCTPGRMNCGRCGCSLPGLGSPEYPMSKFLNKIYSNARPMLLIRTNPLLQCSCVNLQSGTGSNTCTRCFGLGKVVVSLDRFGCYVSSTSPDITASLQSSGLDRAFVKTLYMHRMIVPKEGQLILDVQWNVSNSDVYTKGGLPVVINNVMEIKNVDYVGFNEISYIKAVAVASNDRIPYLQPMLRHNDNTLHRYVNRGISLDNNLRKASTELCFKCM